MASQTDLTPPAPLSGAERGETDGSFPSPSHGGGVRGGGSPGKTVFLCIPSGTAAANLLRTDVFRLLRESPLIGRLVILSPLVREQAFRDEFSAPKVHFEELEPHEPG